MSQWIGAARTNFFQVIDEAKLREWAAERELSVETKATGSTTLFGIYSETDDGGDPTLATFLFLSLGGNHNPFPRRFIGENFLHPAFIRSSQQSWPLLTNDHFSPASSHPYLRKRRFPPAMQKRYGAYNGFLGRRV